MSTRCQIRFRRTDASYADREESDTARPVAQVYRHADGYPASVVQALARLQQLLAATRTLRGPAYAAAQFLFLDKLQSVPLYVDRGADQSIRADDPAALCDPANMAHLDQPVFLLGHGVEHPAAGIHGDEEYLYVVSVPSGPTPDDDQSWHIRVSEHNGFPRCDGPTERAFETATWQFAGTLATAANEFSADAG